MEYIKYEIKNKIGYITLNRPEKRNALNAELVEELKHTFKKAEEDITVKVIILKAEGKAFCAGADLAYLQSLQKNTFDENLADSVNLAELYKQIYTLNKVVIAQVEGHAIAGGAGLATVCDFVFSVPEVKYGYTEVAIGFVPAIVSFFLLRKIGETKTKELLLTGNLISAEQAKALNIYNFIEDTDKIKDATYQFAQKLITNTSGDSLTLTKKLISDIQSLDYVKGLNFAAEINAMSRDTKDCKKGIADFLNKEKTTWDN
ncbi:MAG: enoyl-CoA hydratase/isomerase family protein [Chlorobi bacterium]|nr:enoyl-CoA hydratase/isomerase family protein [Chlorobiota bacterium]